MPSNKSALKRLRQTKVRTAINKSRKSALGTWEKKFRAQVEANELEAAGETMRKALSCYDKAAKVGLIHKNKADRKKAQLGRVLREATAG